ncbi:MAG: catalase family protein, partial [Planctomycetia bacterium]|nr:catalase family protein [Planctomycetia bacterium]
AWVRFSNGARRDDREPDAHGMAVKLMGVGGPKVLDAERGATTHDLVMVDSPAFFLPNAAEYVRFTDAMLKARGARPSVVRSALAFLPEKPRALLALALLYYIPLRLGLFVKLLGFAGKRIADPLSTQYWSATPYLFGEGMAMKFTAVPDVPDTGPPAGGSADSLREAMADRLRAGDVCFEFKVQLQKDERSTPVEDPTVTWPEGVSPPRTVARIRIPAQEFGSTGRMAFCENLSFTPWHAIPEHRPLGGINRVRKDVYAALSRARHDENGTPGREPEPDDPPVGPALLAPGPTTFDEVLAAELKLVHARRKGVGGDAEPADLGFTPPGPDVDKRLMEARVETLDEHVTGLSFSGGGVRAATFAVGVVQGLATLGLLTRFDYL